MRFIEQTITFIYALRDPRTGAIRYIGKSNRPDIRIQRHLLAPVSSILGKWIAELLALNLKPELDILEEVSMSEWQSRERYWISKHRPAGNLLNLVAGGNGFGHHSAEVRLALVARLAAFNRGRKRSAETRKRLSVAMKKIGHKPPLEAARLGGLKAGGFKGRHTEESKGKMRLAHAKSTRCFTDSGREAISRTHRGRVFTQSHRERISLAKTGRKRRPDEIEAMRAGALRRFSDPREREKISRSLLGRKQLSEVIERRRRSLQAHLAPIRGEFYTWLDNLSSRTYTTQKEFARHFGVCEHTLCAWKKDRLGGVLSNH